MIRSLAFLALLSLSQSIEFGFQKYVVLSNPVVTQKSSHKLLFDFKQVVPADQNYQLGAKVPLEFELDTQLSVCLISTLDGEDRETECDYTDRIVKVKVIEPSMQFRITIGQFINPSYELQATSYQLYLYKGTTVEASWLDPNLKADIDPGEMAYIDFQSSNNNVLTKSQYTVRFKPLFNILKDSRVVLFFEGGVQYSNNIKVTAILKDQTITMQGKPDIYVLNQSLEINSLFSHDMQVDEDLIFEFHLDSIINPQSIGAQITLKASIETYEGQLICGFQKILPNFVTDPCQLQNPILTALDRKIRANTRLTLQFEVLVTFDSSLEIIFPDAFDISQATTEGLNYTSTLSGCSVDGNIYKCNTFRFQSTTIQIIINNIQNPYDSTTTEYLQVNLYQTGNQKICECLEFAQFQAQPDAIAIQNPVQRLTQVAQDFTLQFEFSLSNQAASDYNIQVQIPQEQLLLNSDYQCNWGLDSVNLQGLCNYVDKSDYHLFQLTDACLNNQCVEDVRFTVNIKNSKNPSFVVENYSQSIKIYSIKKGLDSEDGEGIIDQIVQGVKLQILTPAQMVTYPVQRNNDLTGAQVTYSLDLMLSIDLPQNSIIYFTFPAGIAFKQESLQCTETGNNYNCAIESQYSDQSIKIVKIIDRCTQSCLANTRLSFAISNLINRHSVWYYSYGFLSEIKTQNGYLIEEGQFDSELLEFQPSLISNLEIERSSYKIKETITAQIKFSLPALVPQANEQTMNFIQISFPSSFWTQNQQVICKRGSDDSDLAITVQEGNGYLTEIKIENYCIDQDCNKNDTIVIKLLQLANPESVKLFNENIQIQIYENTTHPQLSNGNRQDTVISQLSKNIEQQLLPLSFINPLLHAVNPTVSVISNYLLIITIDIEVDNSSYLSITFPSNYQIKQDQINCSHIFNQDIQPQCQYYDNLIKISSFTNTQLPLMVGIKFQGITNPGNTGITTAFSIQLLNEQEELIMRDNNQHITLYSYQDPTTCQNCEQCAGDPQVCYGCPFPNVSSLENPYTCITQCESGYFLKEPERICLKCFHLCQSCHGPDQNQCTSCPQGTYFDNGECKSSCPENTINTNGVCVNTQPCNQCKTCTSNPSFCISCEQGFIFIQEDGVCVQNTEDDDCYKDKQYETNNGDCAPCSNPCFDCQFTPDYCTKCYQNATINLLNLIDNSCIEECPKEVSVLVTNQINGIDVQVCHPCDESCETCEGIGSNQCLECPEGKYMHQGSCLDNCPENTFIFDYNCLDQCPEMHYQKENYCVECNSKCSKCDNATGNCTECGDSFPNLHQNGECVESCDQNSFYVEDNQFNCVSECPGELIKYNNGQNICITPQQCPVDRYYVNQEDDICQSCSQKCKQCDGPLATNCIQCDQESVFKYKNNSECLQQCPIDKFQTTLNDELICVSNCEENYHFTNNDTSLNYCYEECPEKTFYETDSEGNKWCIQCHSTCQTCNSETMAGCIDCDTNYPYKTEQNICVNECQGNTYLYNNTNCVSKCPEGFYHHIDRQGNRVCAAQCPQQGYIDGDNCILCEPQCQTCEQTGPNSCLTCGGAFPYLTIDNNCQSICEDGQFVYRSEGQVLCVDSCINGTVELPNSQECGDDCPAFYFKQSNKCLNCDDSCLTCNNEQSCEKCKDGKVFLDNLCVDDCPQGFYDQNGVCEQDCEDQECFRCDLEQTDNCNECRIGYALHNNSCVQQCPDNYYKQGNECKMCGQGCLNCTENSCQECNNGFYLYQGECFYQCPSGTYQDGSQCVQGCDYPCKTCQPGGVICASCEDDADLLYQGQCLQTCPQGTFQQVDTCENCSDNCGSCKSKEECLNCSNGFYLDKGSCIERCPKGTESKDGQCVQQEDESTEESSITGVPVYILIFLLVVAIVSISISKGIYPQSTDIIPSTLALLSIVEFVERLFMLIFLWIEGGDYQPILFGLTGGFLVGTVVLGMTFIVLYLDPITQSSPTYDNFTESNKKAYSTLYFFTQVFGVHFIRLLYCGLFQISLFCGIKSIGNQSSFRIPLERISLNKLFIINSVVLIQQILTVVLYETDTNSFQIALFGLLLNTTSSGLYIFDNKRATWKNS